MNKMKTIFSCLILIVIFMSVRKLYVYDNIIPKKHEGYVPDEITAIKIAEAIWLPIYGDIIYKEMPFVAKLKNDSIWIVEGSLDDGKSGGTAYIEIRKDDCKIIKVTHGK
jgi:hypothetical protein